MTPPNPSTLTGPTGPGPITVPDFEPFQVRAGRPRSTLLRVLLCWSDPYPPLEHGFRRVHLDGEGGSSVPAPRNGIDRYLMRFRPWATVDTREHLLDFRFDCTTGDGRSGFGIDVTLNVKVTHPEQVVDRGVRRLRPYVQADLWGRVQRALTAPVTDGVRPPFEAAAARAGGPASEVTAARLEIEWLLRRVLGPGQHWAGPFYRALVVGVRVTPDAATAGRLAAAADDGPHRLTLRTG